MTQTHRRNVANLEAPEPGAVQPETGALSTLTYTCSACGGDREREWRTSVDRTLALILKRVDSIEDCIGTVAGGMSNLLGELESISRKLRENGGAKAPASGIQMQEPHTNAATSKPSDWHQSMSQSNAGGMAEGTTTRGCPEKEPPLTPAQPPAAEATRPILVDLDNISSHSGDADDEIDLRNRTPDSLARRVHSRPRLRVVPSPKKILCEGASSGPAEPSAHEPPSAGARTTRYKDPPGYSDLRDFGEAPEPYCKPPKLQPKTHGVSPHTPLSHHNETSP